MLVLGLPGEAEWIVIGIMFCIPVAAGVALWLLLRKK